MAMEELLPCSLNSMQSMHLHIYNVCVYFPPLQWKLQWDQASRVHISFYLFICGSACENPAWKKKNLSNASPLACLSLSLSPALSKHFQVVRRTRKDPETKIKPPPPTLSQPDLEDTVFSTPLFLLKII